MRAGELAAEFPSVSLAAPVLDVAPLLGTRELPGVIVLDDAGRPYTVLPGTELLRLAVPRYCQENPALARVVDEAHADRFLEGLRGRTVRDCLPREPGELPIVETDATVLEVAALMARTRSPVVAVMDGSTMLGAITLHALLRRILSP